jgi:hypothetical protein
LVSSPCIKVCVIDAGSRLCTGCGRTLDEIARWGSMGEPERLQIMATLPERLGAANKEKQA